MTPAQLAMASPLLVGIANPAAKEHSAAIAAGVFVGGFLGDQSVKLLPAGYQTETNAILGGIVGGVLGGVVTYLIVTRKDAGDRARSSSRSVKKARTRTP